MPATTAPEFLTVAETAQMLRMSAARVLRLIHDNRLHAANVGTGERPRWRITMSSIRKFTGLKD